MFVSVFPTPKFPRFFRKFLITFLCPVFEFVSFACIRGPNDFDQRLSAQISGKNGFWLWLRYAVFLLRLQPGNWQQIEAGRPATITTLLRICEAFDVRLESLVGGLDKDIYETRK